MFMLSFLIETNELCTTTWSRKSLHLKENANNLYVTEKLEAFTVVCLLINDGKLLEFCGPIHLRYFLLVWNNLGSSYNDLRFELSILGFCISGTLF